MSLKCKSEKQSIILQMSLVQVHLPNVERFEHKCVSFTHRWQYDLFSLFFFKGKVYRFAVTTLTLMNDVILSDNSLY